MHNVLYQAYKGENGGISDSSTGLSTSSWVLVSTSGSSLVYYRSRTIKLPLSSLDISSLSRKSAFRATKHFVLKYPKDFWDNQRSNTSLIWVLSLSRAFQRFEVLHPQTFLCASRVRTLLHILESVLDTILVGTRFRTCVSDSEVWLQKPILSITRLIMDRTISRNVRLLLSSIPPYYGVLEGENCKTITQFLRWSLGLWLRYSLSHLDLECLILLPSWFLTLSLEHFEYLKVSNLCLII